MAKQDAPSSDLAPLDFEESDVYGKIVSTLIHDHQMSEEDVRWLKLHMNIDEQS